MIAIGKTKMRGLVLTFILLGLGSSITANASATVMEEDSLVNSQKINALDTITFDLTHAVMGDNYVDVPVSFSSDDTVNAVDFSFKFNEETLTYDTVVSHASYLTSLANFNTNDHTLRFTSYALQRITNNTPLISVRFIFNPCVAINKSDFNTVKVYLNGDPCSFKVTDPLSYGANFTSNKLCSGLDVTFNDASTTPVGNISSWSWDLGNGITSTLQNPVTSYTTVGTYTVTLTTTSSIGCTYTVSKPVTVSSSPLANFTFLSDCNMGSVVFADNSTIPYGTIIGWSWDFGDASSSNLQNPSHNYASGGTYTVTLTAVSDSGCSSNYTDVIFLNTPTANFNATNFCIESAVNFTDNSSAPSGTINAWTWDFGDGTTSTQQSPSHNYTVAGTYTVSLSISTNQNCSDSIVKTVTIDAVPTVQFSADALSGCIPLLVNFSDSSVTALGSSYLWDFGDNATSGSMNITHTYTTAGVYTVKHFVTTPGGCTDSLIKTSYITVFETPIVNFSASGGCTGETINFTDNSTLSSGTINNWIWNFGDGSTSTQQNPVHSYTTAGTYTVSLSVASSQSCSDSISKTITIDAKPIVQFSANILSGCAPLTVNFSDLSTTVSGSSYLWSFGDNVTSSSMNITHTYTASGVYTVKHFVTTAGGCTDSLVQTNYINVYNTPAANFNPVHDTVNLPDADVIFTNLSSGGSTWLWNFGDGDSSNLSNPIHTYTDTGTYIVCLTASNSLGCFTTYCSNVIVKGEETTPNVGVPSGFTPNGDTKNDILYVRGGPMAEMEWRIFNEWGNEIFFSDMQSSGWDGKFKSVWQPVGAYVYTLKGKTIADKIIDMKGVVNLLH